MFPKKAVGSITGIGTMAGGIGGVAIQLLAGRLTDIYAQTPKIAYYSMFIICGLILSYCMDHNEIICTQT